MQPNYEMMWRDLREQIEILEAGRLEIDASDLLGMMDEIYLDHVAVNREQYRPGVKVRHKRYKLYGVGNILEIAASGNRARVEWADYDKQKLHWQPYSAYYRLALLEVVDDA
ncbi:hypothetical protein [Paenibacillus apiarius]|uniref:hypothetical protein n=1 Tax=Paenibacillus apiarius TaxID=46240 RepID=UPI003B3AA672